MKQRSKTFLLSLLAVALIASSFFVIKKPNSVASYSYYESLKIAPTSLNGNSIWGGGETFNTVVAAGGLDAWAAFYSASQKASGGLDPSGALSIDGVPYQLNWTGSSDYTGNDTIRLYTGNASATVNLETIGAYEKLYVLGTAGGPGEGNYANFRVRVNYTDNTYDDTTYRLYDWYDETPVAGVYKWAGPARRLVVKSSGNKSDYTYEGSTSGAPFLQSANISVDPKKLVKSIDLVMVGKNDGSNTSGLYCGIYAITGMVNVSAPNPVETIYVNSVSETTADIHWNSVTGATSYRLDIALDPDFKNILPAYNNLQVQDISLVADGLTGDTVYYTRVRAENSEGQSISSNVVSFRTDPETIPPTVSVVANPGLIQIKDDATIIAVDASGVKNIEESLDGGETWSLLVTGDRAEREITENGTYCYRATDNYNNVSDKTCIAYTNLDTAKPVIRVNTNGYVEGDWTNQIITLTVESLTINVGQTQYYYSEDGQTWFDYPGSVLVNTETGLDGKTYYFKAISQAGVESDVVEAFVRRDTTAPVGEISSSSNSWNSFLNAITFGLFFNDTMQFDISASDNLSGVSNIEYLVTANEFSSKEDAQAASGWLPVPADGVSINPEGDFALYYKLTDVAGNVSIVNTDGIILDTTEALIRGYISPEHTYPLEDSKTYYLTQKIIVTDDRALASITLNGESVPLSQNNIIELQGGQTYVVVATDKAGNQTTVTINAGSLSDLNLAITEDNFKTSDQSTIEAVKAKLEEIEATEGANATEAERETLDGLEDKYDQLLNLISELESEIESEHVAADAVPDIDHVTSSDREAIENLISDISATIDEDGTHLTITEVNELILERQELEEKLARLQTVSDQQADLDIVHQTATTIIKTNDKEELEDLRAEAEDLLNGTNLTESERSDVEEEVRIIDELLAQIEAAEAAINTDNIHVADTLLPDAYAIDDKEALENAKSDLEDARSEYGNNYTQAENEAIDQKIADINSAIADIEQQIEDEIRRTTFPSLTIISETERWITLDTAGLIASDAYGISELSVSKDGGASWQAISSLSSATYEVTENGSYIFRAVNSFGNHTDVVVNYHNIDPAKPVVAIDSHGYTLGSWTNSPVTLTASNIANNLSPVALYVRPAGQTEWLEYSSATIVSEDTSSTAYEYKAISQAGLESDIVSAEVKKDSVVPTGTIAEGENSVAAVLNTLTLGLLFKDTHQYILTATDDRSGVESISYYVAPTRLTEAEAQSISQWLATAGTVSVNPEDIAYVYYRLVDRAGNVAVISQDGVVFDLPGLNSVDVTISPANSSTSATVSGSGELAVPSDLEHKTVEDKDTLSKVADTLNGYLDTHADSGLDNTVHNLVQDIEQTIEDINLTEATIVDINTKYDELPPASSITSDSRSELEELIEEIETTEAEKANRLTPTEKQDLDSKLDDLYERLAVLEDVKEQLEDVNTEANGYSVDTIKTDEKPALEELKETILELKDNPNVSSSEKDQLDELLDKIAELEARIQEAEDALHQAEQNDNTSGIDPSNVRPEDQTTLEDASRGYAEALGVFDGNFSLLDLFNINNKISIINSALDVLDQVAEFEAMVSRLPNPEDVTYNASKAIKATQIAYNELSEYAKTLVVPSLIAKYKAVIEAYRAFLEGSPILYAFETLDVFWWAITTFFIVGAFTVIIRRTHHRYAEEDSDKF